jgi:hypothetical protein
VNSITVSTFIRRPQQEVFDFTTDPTNTSRWQSGTRSAQWTSAPPVAVGSVFQSVTKLLGRETRIDALITGWDPLNLWSAKVNNGPMKVEVTNRFESQDGGTLMVQTFQGEVGGFFNMAEGLAFKQMQKQVESDAQTLKTLLEAN